MLFSSCTSRVVSLAVILLCMVWVRHVSSAETGVARISEILWMGSDLSSDDEWVEVGCEEESKNVREEEKAGEACDVSGWTLWSMNAAGTDVLIARFATGTIIEPGMGIMIARKDAASSRLRDAPFIVVSSLTLPNTKLRLTLRDASGEAVDIADDGSGTPFAGANPSGGIGRASMERIRFDLPGSDRDAWRTAEDAVGFDEGAMVLGNPGFVESADKTGETEEISSCGIADPQIDVQSGETSAAQRVTINLQAVSVPSGAVCSWDFGDGFASSSCNPPSHTFREIGSFVIRLSVRDACGAFIDRSLRVEVRAADDASSSLCIPSLFDGVAIGEFLPRPKDGEEEWIELFNNSGMERDLCGWMLDDNEGGSSPFPLDALRIRENERIVLPRSLTKLALNDDADAVRLIDPNGQVAAVPYRRAIAGTSLAERADGVWVWTPHPTPGEGNRFRPIRDVPRTLRISAVLPNPAGDDAGREWLRVHNIASRPMMLAGMSLQSGSRTYVFPSDAALRPGEERQFNADALGLTLANTHAGITLRDADDVLLDRLYWSSAVDGEIIRMHVASGAVHGEVTAINADASLDIGLPGARLRDPFSKILRTSIPDIVIADVEAARAVFEEMLADPHVSLLVSGDILTSEDLSLTDVLLRRGIADTASNDAWRVAVRDDARRERLGMWVDLVDEAGYAVVADVGEPVLVATAGELERSLVPSGDGYAPLQLSEALAVPVAGEEEWIEIVCGKNEGEGTMADEESGGRGCDAGGWFVDDVADGGSKPYRIPDGTFITQSAPLVLTKSQTKLSLNDTGDDVRFLRPDGTQVDVMSFGKLPRGHSVARMGHETCITSTPTPGTFPNTCTRLAASAPKTSTKSTVAKVKPPKPDTAAQAAVRALIAKTTSGSSVETLRNGSKEEKSVFPHLEAIFFLLATLFQVGLWRWLRHR